MVWAERIYELENIHWRMRETCQICRSPENADQTLLCEKCENGWHTTCLNPPLNDIPEGKKLFTWAENKKQISFFNFLRFVLPIKTSLVCLMLLLLTSNYKSFLSVKKFVKRILEILIGFSEQLINTIIPAISPLFSKELNNCLVCKIVVLIDKQWIVWSKILYIIGWEDFSNFSCMFLNPKNFFQFEFQLLQFIRSEKTKYHFSPAFLKTTLGFYYTYWSYYTYCLIFFLIESIISTGRSQ